MEYRHIPQNVGLTTEEVVVDPESNAPRFHRVRGCHGISYLTQELELNSGIVRHKDADFTNQDDRRSRRARRRGSRLRLSLRLGNGDLRRPYPPTFDCHARNLTGHHRDREDALRPRGQRRELRINHRGDLVRKIAWIDARTTKDNSHGRCRKYPADIWRECCERSPPQLINEGTDKPNANEYHYDRERHEGESQQCVRHERSAFALLSGPSLAALQPALRPIRDALPP